MPALVRTPAVPVWFLLMAATGVSFWLGADHGVSSHTLATTIILVVAVVKVRFVGMYFMELREAPAALRLGFQGWCVAICTLAVVMYLVRS
jgi:heme/copper-type cytochrome/quinol oxidase subunit 4